MRRISIAATDLQPIVDMAARGGPYTWLYWLALIGSCTVVYAAAGSIASTVFGIVSIIALGDSNEHANRERVVEKWWARMEFAVVGVKTL